METVVSANASAAVGSESRANGGVGSPNGYGTTRGVAGKRW